MENDGTNRTHHIKGSTMFKGQFGPRRMQIRFAGAECLWNLPFWVEIWSNGHWINRWTEGRTVIQVSDTAVGLLQSPGRRPICLVERNREGITKLTDLKLQKIIPHSASKPQSEGPAMNILDRGNACIELIELWWIDDRCVQLLCSNFMSLNVMHFIPQSSLPQAFRQLARKAQSSKHSPWAIQKLCFILLGEGFRGWNWSVSWVDMGWHFLKLSNFVELSNWLNCPICLLVQCVQVVPFFKIFFVFHISVAPSQPAQVHPDKLPPGSSEETQLQAKHRFQQAQRMDEADENCLIVGNFLLNKLVNSW